MPYPKKRGTERQTQVQTPGRVRYQHPLPKRTLAGTGLVPHQGRWERVRQQPRKPPLPTIPCYLRHSILKTLSIDGETVRAASICCREMGPHALSGQALVKRGHAWSTGNIGRTSTQYHTVLNLRAQPHEPNVNAAGEGTPQPAHGSLWLARIPATS